MNPQPFKLFTSGAKNYHFAVASIELTPAGGETVKLFDPAAEKSPSDVRMISVTHSVKPNGELVGGAAGVPSGSSYYAAMHTRRGGLVLQGLNLDVSKVNDYQRTDYFDYRFDAWVWISDVSKVNTFVIRFYKENLKSLSNANRSMIEMWSYQITLTKTEDIDHSQPGTQTLQTGWNHIVRNASAAAFYNPSNAATQKPTVLNAIGFHEHAGLDPYDIAVASAKFVRMPTAKLESLTVAGVDFTPEFLPSRPTYAANVQHSVSSIAITPTAADENAVITVGGAAAVSGSATTVPLEVGLNEIKVISTLDDMVSEYTLNVTRAEPGSSNANLAGLTLSQGTLTPAFDADVTEYSATVPSSVTSVKLTATVADTGKAALTVDGAAVESGAETTVSLPYGTKTVTVKVTAEDLISTKTYRVAITRELVRPDADGNFKLFDGSTSKNAADLVQTNPAAPAAVTVVDSSALTEGNASPPAGTAYAALMPAGGVKSGIATKDMGWDISAVMDKSRDGEPYQLEMWVYVSDVSRVNHLVIRLFQNNLQDNGAGSWVEFWPYQLSQAHTVDLDDSTPGIQSLKTGWNRIVKYIENFADDVRFKNPAMINAVALEDHAGAKAEYTLAVASVALNKRKEAPATDDRTFPLKELNEEANVINDQRYFYESVINGATVGNSAQLGPGHDNSENGAIWFKDVPLRNGWIVRHGTRANTLLFSGTQSSQVKFWVYVSDAGKVTSTIFELGSTHNPDEMEKEWNFKNQLTQNGWNEITLDFSGGVGTLKLNEIRRYRIAILTGSAEGTMDIAFDSIRMTETGDAIIVEEPPQDDSSFEKLDSELNYDFDRIDLDLYLYNGGYSGRYELDTQEKKQGSAGMKWTSENRTGAVLAVVQSKPATEDTPSPFDFAIEDMSKKYVGFWLYVSDKNLVSQLAFELASTKMDQDEYQWNVTDQIKADGWNYIAIPLDRGMGKIGEFDPNHIRHWRIFVLGNQTEPEVTIRIDDLALVQKKFEPNDDPAKQFDYDFEEINTEKYTYQPAPVLDTDAKQGQYSLKFVSPNTTAGTAMRFYSNPGRLNFSPAKWRTSYVTFWVYVNNPELITRAAFELSSIGVDAADEFEYEFTNQLLSPGWNEIMIPLMSHEYGELNLDHITFSRIFMLGDGSGEEIVVKLDGLRLVDNSETDDDIDWDDIDWGDDGDKGNDDENPSPQTGDDRMPLTAAFITCGVLLVLFGRGKKAEKAV